MVGQNKEINFQKSKEEILSIVLSLPTGVLKQRIGHMQTDDFPEFAVKGLSSLGVTPKPLKKALEVIFTNQDVEEAITALKIQHEKDPDEYGDILYLNYQANIFATAQKRAGYKNDQDVFCYDWKDQQESVC